jgi:hypothetical protein
MPALGCAAVHRCFVVGVAAAFVLAGCSSGEPSSSSEQSTEQQPTVKDLTEDELCDGLPSASIERVLGGKVGSAHGVRSTDDKGPYAWVRCGYVFDSSVSDTPGTPTSLRTEVSPAEEDDAAAELTRRFTDGDGAPQPFESLADLGLAAGYGQDPEPGTGLDPVLVVVFEAGQELYLGEVTTNPEATQDKLQQLAGELLKAVQTELA